MTTAVFDVLMHIDMAAIHENVSKLAVASYKFDQFVHELFGCIVLLYNL